MYFHVTFWKGNIKGFENNGVCMGGVISVIRPGLTVWPGVGDFFIFIFFAWSSCYHHQIWSINLSHCCHIFRGCVSEVVVYHHMLPISYIYIHIYIYTWKAGFCVFNCCAVLWCAQIIMYMIIYGYLHITLLHYHRYADLSEGIEMLKCLADIFCLECVSNIRSFLSIIFHAIETVSPEGTFCDTVQIPSSVGDMELI